ncbi:MAG TPA: hypothetical protein VGZ47_02535 [Gemmataceae bacterium]|jgi:hypothetical protein|nr:hypothetical protein [Gemmataceae bacterium]
MEDARSELLAVLQEARAYLARPDNDFGWSRWKGSGEALSELDSLIAAIQMGSPFKKMDLVILFAPTGAIQEVGMSSGWGWEFLELSKRFDEAEQRFFASESL